MRKRTLAREYALQLLYQKELSKDEAAQDDFWRELGPEKGAVDDEIKTFAQSLVSHVKDNLDELDRIIRESAEHWDPERMAVVDRNILRLGCAELLYEKETPAKVVLNEAIELAKKFGDTESSRFVNGILDRISKSHSS